MTTQYTPNKNLPYPQLTDTPNVPRDIQALATSIDGLTLTNFGTITSTQLISIVSGYTTGTGNLVFSNSPTLVTPILGVATATNLITNATITGSSATGAISYGTLSYSDTNNFLTLQTNANNYAQLILQNTNSGTTASSDVVISNNLGNATTYYINLGMNSSGFTGSGSFNLPNAGYLSTTTGDLVLGTTTANAIRFVVNNGTTDVITIASTGAITINNPITTTSTINGTTIPSTANLVTSADASVVIPTQTANSGKYLTTNGTSLSWAAPTILGKNAIINGGMDIWQRGTSFTNPSTVYFADRWWLQISGAMTFSQETTTVPVGAKNSIKVVAAAAQTFNINQPIETLNAIQYAGKTVTLSLQTQTSIVMPLTITLLYSTTVDNAPGGTWTTIAPTSGGTFNGTVGSFTQNSATFSVPSTAKSLMVFFGTNGLPSGGFTLYVGQIQLELGSTATTFSRAGGSIGGELALCQRYYFRESGTTGQITTGFGVAYSTTNFYSAFKPKVTMRIIPTLDSYSNLQASNGISTLAVSSAIIWANSTIDSPSILCTTAGTFTSGSAWSLAFSGTGYVGFSAEL
jgi:hypothetical protein